MSIYLRWHLGLGDAIICNGLVRELAKRHDKVYLPAKLEKMISVFWMFSDLENVRIVPVKDDSEMNEKANQFQSIGLGIWSKGGLRDWSCWDQQFYEDARVSFEARWSQFKVPECKQAEPPSGDYAFIHHDPARGMTMRKVATIPIYEPSHAQHIFWNVSALQRATEIHVVNSSFLNLAESLPLCAKRLVVHNYARIDRAGIPTLRKHWEVLC
jgi:hypothetical protein